MVTSTDKKFYSPRKIAEAIGVSESSLKRWCDKGLLRFSKTAGGHRRIFRADAIQFVRESETPLSKPEVLGLPSLELSQDLTTDALIRDFENALLSEHEEAAHKIILSAFVQGWPLYRIFDDVIAAAFRRVGEMWEAKSIEIYKERHCCEIATNVLRDLRTLVPVPPENAPLAIGGSLAGDNYSLPSLMVEILLTSLGWNAKLLGCNIPVASLIVAARNHRPKLVWVSVSAKFDEDVLVRDLNQLRSELDPSTALVIGGRGVSVESKRKLGSVIVCDTMKQLDSILANMKPSLPMPGSNESTNSQTTRGNEE